jgi:hypothetical protein
VCCESRTALDQARARARAKAVLAHPLEARLDMIWPFSMAYSVPIISPLPLITAPAPLPLPRPWPAGGVAGRHERAGGAGREGGERQLWAVELSVVIAWFVGASWARPMRADQRECPGRGGRPS